MGSAQPGTRRPFALTSRLGRGGVRVAPACAVTVALALTAALPARATTQVVRGAVTEAGTGHAVDGAVVRLIAVDSPQASQQVAMLLTGRDGSFVVVAPRGGLHVLEVEHVLYEPARTPPFAVPPSGATARLVRLVPRSPPANLATRPLRAALDPPTL